MQETMPGLNLYAAISDLESTLIKKALEISNGNRAKAAHILSINRTTLLMKMKKLGLMNTSKCQIDNSTS